MSRIGKKPVPVPAGVKVQVVDHTISVEGPLGKLEWEFRPEISVAFDDNLLSANVDLQAGRDGDRFSTNPRHDLLPC